MTFYETSMKIGALIFFMGLIIDLLSRKYPSFSEAFGEHLMGVGGILLFMGVLDLFFDFGKWIWGLFK